MYIIKKYLLQICNQCTMKHLFWNRKHNHCGIIMESYYRNILEDANNNIQHLYNINDDSNHWLDTGTIESAIVVVEDNCEDSIGNHYKKNGTWQDPGFWESQWLIGIFFIFLKCESFDGKQCNLGLPCFWKSEDKEKGHLWQKESSARSVSNIFLWQPAPPSPWSPQQLPFPDALSKPGTG